MKQSYVKLPVLTGDVSGAASALYEFGGMFVIHDPSGCNSTYNTHDELRWYDKESLIFISGLTDREAVNGDDSRLIRETVDTALYYRPRFIAMASSPIPYLNGTDFNAVCGLVEQQTGIPAFHVETNAMHDYVRGAGLAYRRFAEKLLPAGETASKRLPGAPLRVAVFGLTPLDFPARGCAGSLRTILERGGFDVVSQWSMGETFEGALRAAEANVSLVVSSAGLRAAKLLWEKCGTPWVAGLPVGALKEPVFRALRSAAAGAGPCSAYLPLENAASSAPVLTVVGEPVSMGSLGAAYALEHHCRFRIVAATEDSAGLISRTDTAALNEEDLTAALEDAVLLLGDPMYRAVAPAEAEFLEQPYFALSGRLYLSRVADCFADS